MREVASSKRIVFINMVSEADEYLARSGNIVPAGDFLIAMNPSVHANLKAKGVEAAGTLSYFTNESHIKALEKSEGMMEYLRRNSDFLDMGIGIEQSYRDFFVYRARCSVLFFLWSIEVVSNAVNAHYPEVVCGSCASRNGVVSLYIEPEEKYLGQVIRLVARHKKLRYEDISGAEVTGDIEPKIKISDRAYQIAKSIGESLKFFIWRSRIPSGNIPAKDRPVLFTTRNYRMNDLCAGLGEDIRGLRTELLPGPFIPAVRLPAVLERIMFGTRSDAAAEQRKSFEHLTEKIKADNGTFSFNGIVFADLLIRKIRTNIADYLVGLMLWSVRLERLLDLIRPRAVISNGNRPEDGTLAELCNIKGIPDILISHGSHVRPKNRYETIEWGEHGRMFLRAPFSFVALQTPLAEGYLESFPSGKKIIKTGPLIWGTAVDKEASRSLFDKFFKGRYEFGKVKVVVHAGTPKPSNSLRLYTYETPDEYIRSVRELADAVKEMPGVVLIVKFRPSKEISVEAIKDNLPTADNILLSVEDSLKDVLGMSDLLVSFSSTTIEEALQNNIPVLLYGCERRYQHVNAFEISRNSQVIRSAAYSIKDANDLKYGISKILDLGSYGAKDRGLFEPYRYSEEKRSSLSELLKI